MSISSSTIGGKIKYKIVFLGDQAVGKSSMIQKYIYDKFDETGNPTIGIDFLLKNVVYKNLTYKLQLWDTAGQQRFRSLIPTYLKDANCAIIVYDITNKNSLLNVEKWYNMYKQYKSESQFTILVGNKIDLTNRVISKSQGELKAKELQIQYMEVSAKTGKKLQQLFQYVIQMISSEKHNGIPHQECVDSEPKVKGQLNKIQLQVIPQKRQSPKKLIKSSDSNSKKIEKCC